MEGMQGNDLDTPTLLAFLYTLFLDFDGSYVKAPKHFPYRRWFVKFQKSNVKAPLVELNEHGDYREALERGSNLASFCLVPLFLRSWDHRTNEATAYLVSRQAIPDSTSSQPMGHNSQQDD